MKNFNENGRSMVEMLGVLAIIGVLSVGGIAGYSKAMNKYKINKTTDQVSMLVANIRTLFSSQGNYAGLSNAQAKKFGVVPNDMYTKVSSADIKNAFNGSVTIVADKARSSGDSGSEAFIVEYNGLPSEACVTILTGDWGSGQASGLIGIAGGKGPQNAPAAGSLGDIGKKLNAVYVDSSTPTANNAANAVVAVPGAATGSASTPVTVTNAVAACTGAGSTNSVAWKYY